MISGAFVGGLLGTLVLTTIIRTAAEIGLTRMDLALILGTMGTTDRRRARAVGYGVHLGLGFALAAVYAMVFQRIGWSAWWLGALFGTIHALFLATVVLNVLLPVVHPMMGTPETAANESALIEPPGFLMRNYGQYTLPVLIVSHAAFGAVVAWAVRI
jgi:hypothetical protein